MHAQFGINLYFIFALELFKRLPTEYFTICVSVTTAVAPFFSLSLNRSAKWNFIYKKKAWIFAITEWKTNTHTWNSGVSIGILYTCILYFTIELYQSSIGSSSRKRKTECFFKIEPKKNEEKKILNFFLNASAAGCYYYCVIYTLSYARWKKKYIFRIKTPKKKHTRP